MHHVIIWYTIIKATAWYCSKHLYIYVLKFAKQGLECLWMLPVRARVFMDAACEDQSVCGCCQGLLKLGDCQQGMRDHMCDSTDRRTDGQILVPNTCKKPISFSFNSTE